MNLYKKNTETQIQTILLNWYRKNKRNLPWRKINNNNLPYPYYVFVSEYMLQQTTVGTVKNRFKEFILKWPSVNDLAKISDNEILIMWSGLGYYSRATNLLKAAKIIKKNFKSKIPNNYEDLLTLPGVGDYTAKAILGICYNKPMMPIDANIERILARLYGLQSPLIKIKKQLKDKSLLFISKNYSTNLIQAFMDYGSLICTPRSPSCNKCLIQSKCLAYKKNLQNIIPLKVKLKSKKRKKYSRAYILYNEKNEILVRKRPAKGMLASMLEVPNDNWIINKKKLVHDKIFYKIKSKLQSKGFIEYSFSHFDLETEVFIANVKKNNFTKSKWMKKNHIEKSSMPTVMRKIIEVAI